MVYCVVIKFRSCSTGYTEQGCVANLLWHFLAKWLRQWQRKSNVQIATKVLFIIRRNHCIMRDVDL